MAAVEDDIKCKQTKKRSRNPSEWKREKRKRLRIAGKEYVNCNGAVVSERRIGPDCKCRRKCYKLVPEEYRNQLFDGYYSLNSHDEQNAYLFGLIRKHDIARKRSKDSDLRTCSYKYYVRIRGGEVQVCRLAFAHMHGISPHKIRVLCQKQDQNVLFPRDERGKHKNRPRRISEDTIGQIKEHIFSIMKSDRIRDFLKEEKHCGPDVNITKMWKDYLEKYDPNFSELHLGNEKTNSLQQSCVIEHGENFQNPGSEGRVSMSGYQLPPIIDSLQLVDHRNDSHGKNGNDGEDLAQTEDRHHNLFPNHQSNSHCKSKSDGENFVQSQDMHHNLFLDRQYHSHCESGNDGEEKVHNHPTPVVKHWLYSKVFHEEFKLHDFLTLKKKLWHLKDSSTSASQSPNKAERKQKSPKKFKREKDASVNIVGVQSVPATAPDQPANQTGVHHYYFQNMGPNQGPDMYILPVNIQDLSQFPQATEMQHHAMQLNFHTFSTPTNMNVQAIGPGQSAQCSTMTSLPVGAVNLSQNACGYVNAAFY